MSVITSDFMEILVSFVFKSSLGFSSHMCGFLKLTLIIICWG